MKELSIEEKAKAYDEALERAKSLIGDTIINESGQHIAEVIFPELKELEDERIRRDIIRYLKKTSPAIGENIEKMLAWLEKQGEFYTKRDVDNAYIEGMAFAKDELEKQGEQKQDPCEKCDHFTLNCHNFPCIKKKAFDQSKLALEAIKEEKVDNANKVEPKFKVGDFIVNDYCMGKVIELTDDAYLLDTEQGIPFSYEHNAHLWSIQDAKDGDVLSDGTTIFIFKDLLSDGSVMSYCDYDTDSGESDAFCPLSVNLMCSKITPATKEQRDILFQKMREASYEWDAEKKELKKINSYCQENCKGFQEIGKCFTDGECKAKREAEQKPTNEEMKTLLRTEYEKGKADVIAEFQKAWSEEDESYLNTTIAYLKDAKEFKKTAENCIKWLKSLKDRVQPKQEWSEEDEQYLLVCKNALAKYQTTDKWDAGIISCWLEDKLKSLRPQPKQEILEKLEEWLDEYVSNLADVDTASLIGSFTNYLDGKLPVKPKKME